MNISRPCIVITALSILLTVFLLLPGPSFSADASLDAASIQCIGCHESGLNAQIVFHGKGSDHPIGLDYVRLARNNGSLVPASQLNPALRLDHGRIGCLTCHVPYAKKNHLLLAKKRAAASAEDADPMLTLDNKGSGLCMACHQK